jgi:hypothetical protein
MPLEIRELVIKVTVEENTGKTNTDVADKVQALKAQLVNECVAKLLTKLENASDR